MALFLHFLWIGIINILFSIFFLAVSGESNGRVHETSQTFIVRVQNDLKPSHYSHVVDWYTSTLNSVQNDNNLLYVYSTVFHGFSAKLSKEQALELKKRPEILGVFTDRIREIQTTRSPQFLGLEGPSSTSGLVEADWGSNVIIGVIDTGIWPERRSFNDEGLGPVPSRWKGECVAGDQSPKILCNKKLIGARYFNGGHVARFGDHEEKNIIKHTFVNSARDDFGHGTHTASTAAGRRVENASFIGFAQGVSSGIAPKARLAVYKVCWGFGCSESDILAGIDAAVNDGVDVISISIGGGSMTYDEDPIAIAAFGAMQNYVVVTASAGNWGPELETVTNAAPWVTTVGAGTLDRTFPADLVLGDGSVVTGSSLYGGKTFPAKKYFPLIYAGNAAVLSRSRRGENVSGLYSAFCVRNSLDQDFVRGKIVLCNAGESSNTAKGVVVKEAGGVGLIVANVAPMGDGLTAAAYLSPGLSISESARATVLRYITSTENPRATLRFRGTHLGDMPAPEVSSFSSRGPNPQSPYVLKPDLIAPGVNILAAWPDGVPPSWQSSDPRQTEFNIISGTSMSCPHVSGISALLKGAHPDWTPAIIKSAMMTTAYNKDRDGKPLQDETNNTTATVWDVGAGHVDPLKALDPGLVYSLTEDDYISFLCASEYSNHQIKVIARREVDCSQEKQTKPWELNYPAIVVRLSASNLEVSVPRTVTHVSDGASTYTVKVTSPRGATVSIDPKMMSFTEKDEKKSYVVKIKVDNRRRGRGGGGGEFGVLTWTDGTHLVTSPLVVNWVR